MQPCRELRLSSKLPQTRAELGQRLLGGIARIFRIFEQVQRQALDFCRMAFAQRSECAPVAVFRSLDQDRVAQPLVDKRLFWPLPHGVTTRAQRRLQAG